METRAANPNAGGGEDAMLSFPLLLALAGGGCWFLWHKFHPQISTYVIAAQHWEMVFIGHFTDRYAVLDQQAQALDPSAISFNSLYGLCHMVGLFFRIPAAVLIGVMALWCLGRNAPSNSSPFIRQIHSRKPKRGCFGPRQPLPPGSCVRSASATAICVPSIRHCMPGNGSTVTPAPPAGPSMRQARTAS